MNSEWVYLPLRMAIIVVNLVSAHRKIFYEVWHDVILDK